GAMTSACVVSHGEPVQVRTATVASAGSGWMSIRPSPTEPPSAGWPDSADASAPDRSVMSTDASAPATSMRSTCTTAGLGSDVEEAVGETVTVGDGLGGTS